MPFSDTNPLAAKCIHQIWQQEWVEAVIISSQLHTASPNFQDKLLLDRLKVYAIHSRAPKKNTSHGNEVLPQDTTHLIQRPCYQQGSPCQDPASNRTTRRPADHGKETQTAVVWSCLTFIRSGQNHLVRHSERGK